MTSGQNVLVSADVTFFVASDDYCTASILTSDGTESFWTYSQDGPYNYFRISVPSVVHSKSGLALQAFCENTLGGSDSGNSQIAFGDVHFTLNGY
jgi:hypothetical protein